MLRSRCEAFRLQHAMLAIAAVAFIVLPPWRP
jgi:hypothetical protein